jgi:membrane protein
MPSIKARIAALRQRRPLIDHAVRMQEHYSAVKAGQQAGAITYFGFLSFCPILALAFFVVGLLARVYTDAGDNLTEALDAVMPGVLGTEQGQSTLAEIEKYATTVGIIGAAVLLYSGLGWVAAMRAALVVVFQVPAQQQPNFVFGKLRDLLTLVLIGVILVISVVVAGLVGGFSTEILSWLNLGEELGWLVKLLTVVLGFGANMLLFFALFVLLAKPNTPRRSLWSGALLGAVAFEILKQVSGLLIQLTEGNAAFQAFGIALIVLVWINYFSRVVLYAAAWAHTSRAARAARPAPAAAPVEGPPSPPVRQHGSGLEYPWAASYAAGAATMLGLVAVTRRLARRTSRKDS